MKQAILFTLSVYLIIAFAHLILWPMNKRMYHRILKDHENAQATALPTLKSIRIKLEADKKKELATYRWIDQRKEYAQIPIERAFDYYLNLHKLPHQSERSPKR